MLNKKVILLCGYSRGGTNIVWNILQSHPQIVSSRYETGEILRKQNPIILSRQISIFYKLGILNTKFVHNYLDYRFYKLKLSNLNQPDNKYKREGVLYSKEELKDCAVCFKSVDFDINHTDLLLNMYPNLYLILLTRNGNALADGHMRRGKNPDDFADLYNTIAHKMKFYSEKVNNFKLIKFEDVLNNPFKIAKELYDFTNSNPSRVDKLRLKSKKIVTEEGKHQVSYGNEHRKYWFDRDNVFDFLDPSVNSRQKENLTDEVQENFKRKASSALDFFGY